MWKESQRADTRCAILPLIFFNYHNSKINPELITAKMAESASTANQPCHIRSISLPSRSHPAALRVEEELRNLRSSVGSESSAPQKICDGLRQLGGLYESVKELLSLTSCQLQKKLAEEELDASIRLLDLCCALKDSLTTMKDHIQGVQLAVRRRDGTMITNKMNDYVRFGRKADKDIKNCFRSLKQMEDKCIDDNEMSMATRMMMEVKVIAISFLQLVSSFLTRQTTRPSSNRWSFVSKALSKRRVTYECQHEDIFSLLFSNDCIASKDVEGERVLKAKSQLQMLEVSIEELESGLDCLFRQLIQFRVSLLNMLSS